jgi:Abortive infection C-terminus
MRTHSGHPDSSGQFGINNCVGSVRNRHFDAVIGVGGLGSVLESWGIAGKLTWVTGLLAIVEGIGTLRTHASSAHGAGKTTYRLEPRHARLAIHAAHTVVLFSLETGQAP